MKKLALLIVIVMLVLPSAVMAGGKGETLKDVLGKYFLIGTALNVPQTDGRDIKGADVAKNNFNAIVAENCMKGEVVQPVEGRFNWTDADKLVEFGEKNGMAITGHCLVWHSQAPRWMFKDSLGNKVSREVLIARMHKHIATVVGHYKGKIKGWDVVNEAIEDDGTFRHTPYYDIIGPEYIDLAFQYAAEADPNTELYYNDFSMAKPAKRAAVCRLVRHLKNIGCREIHQNYQYDKKYNPYPDGLDKAMTKKFEDRYLEFFRIYRQHASQISRVTLWGVADGNSWLNNWPIHGRSNYPLLFDRDYKAKPVIKKIINLFK